MEEHCFRGSTAISVRPGPFGLTWFMNNPDYYGGLKVGHEGDTAQYRFHTVEGRFVISFLAEGREHLYAERYDQGTISDVWADRQGVYSETNINPGGELWPGTNTLAIEVGNDNILRLKGTLRGNIPIKPLIDTLAITGGIGRNRGEIARVVTVDGEEQIELWGFRYKRTTSAPSG